MCGEGRQYYSMEIHVEEQIDAATFCLPPCSQEHGFLQERYLQNTASAGTQNSVKIFPFCQNRVPRKTYYANKPRLPVRQATAFLRTRHAYSALLPRLPEPQSRAFGGFWHRYFTDSERQSADNQSNAIEEKNGISSGKPHFGRKQAILRHQKQRKRTTPTTLGPLTHGMAHFSPHNQNNR